jgi:hypothetical protein
MCGHIIIFVADIPDWPEADLIELMKRMEKEIPQKDSLRFDSRADKLNWNNVRQQSFLNVFKIWIQDFYLLDVRSTKQGFPARTSGLFLCVETRIEEFINQ